MKKANMENGFDYICKLPDPILRLILSRLGSTIDVVRTSVLSTRWEYLWTSVPSLYIDAYRNPTDCFNGDQLKDFVYCVLLSRTQDLDSFTLHILFGVETIVLPSCLVGCGSLKMFTLNILFRSLSLKCFTGSKTLKYGGHMANHFSFDVKSLMKAVIELEDMKLNGEPDDNFGVSICELFAQVSHVEYLSINRFFHRLKFKEDFSWRPSFSNNLFKTLSSEDVSLLNQPFSIQEIKDAIWSCGASPDGFTFKLIKKHWNLLGPDIISYVKEFESSNFIPVGCNSSFTTLIPKTEDPLLINDFRPISLIGCQYKIIAKILANRLAFVISSVTPTKEFKLEKGLRLGDPLSPLLFILAVEAFNVAILEAKDKKLFSGFEVGKDKINVSHL
ncbi:transposon TX1 uncharacterized [Tanacetum coccineum]